jgi:glutamate-1-semialdehyde 2,1-aminomutase
MTRYQQSQESLARAEKVIPLGSQTFSKSKTQFPYGVSPYFLTKGQGCKVWDIDGNEYIDFVCSLLAISLGYCDPDVDQAVRQQMEQGVIFSLPHPLETELAEKIVEMVPCAEMVRFGKNGSDATAGAVRLARAYTKRDHVVVCGYHGWQDWYIGSTERDAGVPGEVKALTHKFIYNDLASLEKCFNEFPDQVAAVVMEPVNFEEPKPGFLQSVKEICHKNDALLIFDETITGFRFAKGGAQELFGVTPDLTTMGKGAANGYPLSIVAGSKDIMCLMEEIFFSFTFGGETLSLAAGLAVMNKMQREPVLEHMQTIGKYLMDEVGKLIQQYELESILSIKGYPVWSLLVFKDDSNYSSWQIKTFWMQEVLVRGILSFGSHNLCYAHQKEHVDQLLAVYQEVFALLKEHLGKKTLEKAIKGKVLEPLFKVR